MSEPIRLDPRTDVTKEAKLNTMCQECSRITHEILMLQESCSTNPGSPTLHIMDHHGSSSGLIMSANDGCHLCTLLLGEIEDSVMEDMRFLEAKYRIGKRQANEAAKPSYCVRLKAFLYNRGVTWRHRMYRPIMKYLNFSTFHWPEVRRKVSIKIVLPSLEERQDIAGNIHNWSWFSGKLYVEHQLGLFTLSS